MEQRLAISDVLMPERKTRHLDPTWQDIDVLESVNAVLRPLEVFTDALSAGSYVSVSYVKPVIHLLKTSQSHLAEKEDDSDLTKTIKQKIMRYLDTKYDDPTTQELLDTASFVDPRFKVKYISREKVQDIKTRVMSEMKEAAQKVIRLYILITSTGLTLKLF